MSTLPGTAGDRDRPPKPALSRDLIVATALALLAGEGLPNLSMRKVAAVLDTGAASLYVYVRDREHLLRLMTDQVMADVPLTTPADGDWQARIVQLAAATLAAYARYPGLASQTLGVIPTGEQSMRLAEHMVELLRLPALPDQVIAWAIDILGLYITANAVEADIFRAAAASGQTEAVVVAEAEAAFRALSPARFPELARLLPYLMQGGEGDRFNWGMRVLLHGLTLTGPTYVDQAPGEPFHPASTVAE